MSRRPPMPFEQLLAPLQAAGLLEAVSGDLQTPIVRLSHDSRTIEPDTCFFAVQGGQVDGHLFLDKAVQHGATAAVCERPPEGELPALRALARVSDARAALAEAAAIFFGRPSEALRLIGVTGTNGKTTVSHLIYNGLAALGETPGLIGTVEVRIGDRSLEATHTTPDALALNDLLAEMVESGCRACAMEVSSHALEQERVRGQRFAAAVFTNLTHEHLDYHGTFDAYARVKARLFENLPPGATAIVNRDDPSWPLMVNQSPARVVTFGREESAASSREGEIGYHIQENVIEGLLLRIDGVTRRFRMPGAFNAANYAAAYAALRALGYRQAEALGVLSEAPPIPGRLQTLVHTRPQGERLGPIAVVDYAHTPDALENVLRTVRDLVPEGGALRVVFGCGGDRDRGKRPLMGRIAAEVADHVLLTNDNPRTEPPEAILESIVSGMPHPPDAVIPDRAAAIRAAVGGAADQDVVVIAGKGHETYQVVGTERHHFDDREQARLALEERANRHETS